MMGLLKLNTEVNAIVFGKSRKVLQANLVCPRMRVLISESSKILLHKKKKKNTN